MSFKVTSNPNHFMSSVIQGSPYSRRIGVGHSPVCHMLVLPAAQVLAHLSQSWLIIPCIPLILFYYHLQSSFGWRMESVNNMLGNKQPW